MCIKFETEEISITGLAARVIRKTKIEEKVRSFALRVSLFQESEIVGSAELRKHKHENITEGNWGEKRRQRLSLPSFFLFPAPPTFYLPFTFASSPLG